MVLVPLAMEDIAVVTAATLTAIVVSITILRLVVRIGIVRRAGADDYLSAAATTTTVLYCAGIIAVKSKNDFVEADLVFLLKLTLGLECVYWATVFLIKASIVTMYLRFAVSKIFRALCYGTIGVLVVLFLVSIGGTLGRCRPFQRQWDIEENNNCFDPGVFFFTLSLIGILLDGWLLLIPVPTLLFIDVSNRDKAALFGTFGTGILSTAVSCVRLRMLHQSDSDRHNAAVTVMFWSIIEICSGIVCASLPALKPLLARCSSFGTGSCGVKRSGVFNVHGEAHQDDFELARSSARDNRPPSTPPLTEHGHGHERIEVDRQAFYALTAVPGTAHTSSTTRTETD